MPIRLYPRSADDPQASARQALTDWSAHPNDTILVDRQGGYAVCAQDEQPGRAFTYQSSPEELEKCLRA